MGDAVTVDAEKFEADIKKAQRRMDWLYRGAGRDLIRKSAREIVCAHPLVADYFEQAPICLMLAMDAFGERTYASFDQKTRKNVANSKIGQPKLRSFMEQLWLEGSLRSSDRNRWLEQTARPGLYQLRMLKGNAIRLSYFEGMKALAWIDPSSLAQLIPKTYQEKWLSLLSIWVDQICRRLTISFGDAPANAALKMTCRLIIECPVTDTFGAEHLADYMAANEVNYGWSGARVLKEIDAWNKRAVFEDSKNVVSYAPFFSDEPEKIKNVEFVPLRSHGALIEETQAMHHCVHSYWDAVRDGRCFIFSVRVNGERDSTLEVTRWRELKQQPISINDLAKPVANGMIDVVDRLRPGQFRGPFNDKPPGRPPSLAAKMASLDFLKAHGATTPKARHRPDMTDVEAAIQLSRGGAITPEELRALIGQHVIEDGDD